MRFSILPVLALILAPSVLAVPSPDPVADVEIRSPAEPTAKAGHLVKRSVSATVTADALKYRTCPRTSCTAVGQYPQGTTVHVNCFTRTNTTPVNGDAGWALLTNGYYVAMYYLDWEGYIYGC